MIKINQKLIPGGIILYENASGTNGNVTLNDNLTNYKYVDIVFKITDGNFYDFLRVYSPDGKTIGYNRCIVDTGQAMFYLLYKSYSLSGTTITKNNINFYQSEGGFGTYDNIRIVEVIGYY